jgi:multidrug efflux pump subunit AcrA (membrane-fusion protein)
MVEARALPRTISIGVGAALAIAALFVVPWNFKVSCSGTLQPSGRREVFAPLDGTVVAVHVKHGDRVDQDAPLVDLRNTDLEVALSDVTGQRMATQEQILSVDRARTLVDKGKSATPEERNRLEGQRSELRQKLASLDQQLEVYRQKRQQLAVQSPIAGNVTTWNVEQLLRERPVRQGQVLVSVADAEGPWELELRMPEYRMGDLVDAEKQLAAGLPVYVTYRLATSPGVDHEGTVTEIHRSAELHGDDGNIVLVKVAIDKERLTALRPGADVTAKVHCGRRSLGYTLFHDVIAFVQSRILFNL